MDLRKSFDKDVINFEKYRTRYCDELFRDVIEYSKLNYKKTCLEIGCGTGQATEPILKTDCTLLAIELGENFTKFTRDKFKSYKNFQVENADFEEYDFNNNQFDLVFSATAFHWIPDEVGYPKIYNALKSNGTLALFWNQSVPEALDHPLHLKVHDIYLKYYDAEINKKAKLKNEKPQFPSKEKIDAIKKYGFIDVDCRIYKQIREFTADEYVSLISTYSNYSALPEANKSRFFAEMKEAIYSFDNKINVYDTMDLYLARKP